MRLLREILSSRVTLALVDLVLAHTSIMLAFFIRFGRQLPEEGMASYYSVVPYLTVAALALFYLYDLYEEQVRPWNELATSIAVSVGLLYVVTVVASFYLRALAFPRSVILLSLPIHLGVMYCWRFVAWEGRRHLVEKQRALVIGVTAHEVDEIASKLEASPLPVMIAYRLCELPDDAAEMSGEFGRILSEYQIQTVLISGGVSLAQREWLLQQCLERQIRVSIVPGIYEILLSKARVSQIGDTPILNIRKIELSPVARLLKRFSDVIIAGTALLLTWPIMVLIGVAIYVDSPGPVIYRQERVSENGRIFTLYKFRTMVLDAEKYTGPVLATANDPRLTRVGKFLRASRLDELPQLFNILKGDMSVVGPRPERPVFVESFRRMVPWYAFRLRMKPGLTGLAQVTGKYSTSVEDKLRYDMLYAVSQSLATDIRILAKTIRTVFLRDRAS